MRNLDALRADLARVTAERDSLLDAIEDYGPGASDGYPTPEEQVRLRKLQLDEAATEAVEQRQRAEQAEARAAAIEAAAREFTDKRKTMLAEKATLLAAADRMVQTHTGSAPYAPFKAALEAYYVAAATFADALLADPPAHEARAVPNTEQPTIVCLCGSTRFGAAFQDANLHETLAGRIVLSIGCNMKSDGDLFACFTDARREQVKRDLDELHKRKIDLADEILVLNVGGYIGTSTRGEVEYARQHGKRVRWLESSADVREGERVESQAAQPGEGEGGEG